MTYRVEWDENGDDECTLEEPWSLPQDYARREQHYAALNASRGHSELAVLRHTAVAAVQAHRAKDPHWGARFREDPRPFTC